MKEGDVIRRKDRGVKEKGHGTEKDEEVGEEGVVTRVYSFKWAKIETADEVKYVRTAEFEEV